MIGIGIGSNQGDRLKNLQEAVALLAPLFSDGRVSGIIESPALLLPHSPAAWNCPFLNCVFVGNSPLSPHHLLIKLKEIEQRLGRNRRERWAPREIDLDILCYHDQVIQEPHLEIPHKELLQRDFVLYPLAQLLPYWRYPSKDHCSFGKTLLELLHQKPLHFHRSFILHPFLIGVVNLAPDSFSDGGELMEPERAADYALQLFEEGASFLDLSPTSSRPGSTFVTAEEEWHRLEPLLKLLKNASPLPRLSVETYHTETAFRALDHFEISMLNFVGPTLEGSLAQRLAQEQKKVVIMHSLSLPPSPKQVLPLDQDPIEPLLQWGRAKIDALEQYGVERKNILLDPGIGFGKSALQNQIILKRINELSVLGAPLYVGHSRKSLLNFTKISERESRDRETTALSLYLAGQGVSYLRVHNIKMHVEELVSYSALSGETHAS